MEHRLGDPKRLLLQVAREPDGFRKPASPAGIQAEAKQAPSSRTRHGSLRAFVVNRSFSEANHRRIADRAVVVDRPAG